MHRESMSRKLYESFLPFTTKYDSLSNLNALTSTIGYIYVKNCFFRITLLAK